jgi:benzoylformate decarboxylase
MADGYAQAAGKPGFINLHTAGGLGHGMGNLLNASVSCTPLVVTAGQQDSRHTITDPLLLGDLVSIARPAVKWAQDVTHADQLPVLLRRAFQDANAAPSGPTFLSLPMDVMDEMTTVSVDVPSTINRRSVAGSLEALADHLTGILPGRLAIIAGDEIHSSDAADEARDLAETLAARVFGSSWLLSCVGARWAGACRRPWAVLWDWDGNPSCVWLATEPRCIRRRHCGLPPTKSFR